MFSQMFLGICMGFPQTGNTHAVAIIGVLGRPARTAVTVGHLQQCQFALLDKREIAGWRQRMGPDCCDAGERGNLPSRSRLLGPAARLVNGEQASGISRGKVVVAEGE